MDDWTLHEGNRLQEQINKYSQQMRLIPELVKYSHHHIKMPIPGLDVQDVVIPEEIEGAIVDLLIGCYKRLYDNAKKEFEDL